MNCSTTSISMETQSGLASQSISDPQIETIKKLIASKITHDPFGNCTIDLSTVNFDHMHAAVLESMLPEIVDAQKNANKHIVAIKISPGALALSGLYKTVINSNFVFHQGHPNVVQLNNCLKGHSVNQCTYPKHKTSSLGVTGVVFNSDLTEFAAIQELDGPYKGWKAMTGTLEDKEEPIAAAVREIAEETNIIVNPKDGVFVGTIRTQCFRGENPDYNDVFAFTTDKNAHTIEIQNTEIRAFKWYKVDQFLVDPAPVKHNNPLIVKAVVQAAREALQNNTGWKAQTLYWGSGKMATFYGPQNRT